MYQQDGSSKPSAVAAVIQRLNIEHPTIKKAVMRDYQATFMSMRRAPCCFFAFHELTTTLAFSLLRLCDRRCELQQDRVKNHVVTSLH